MMHVRVATHVPAHPPVYSTLPLSFRACVLDARCRLMAMPFAPGGVVPFPTSTKRAEDTVVVVKGLDAGNSG